MEDKRESGDSWARRIVEAIQIRDDHSASVLERALAKAVLKRESDVAWLKSISDGLNRGEGVGAWELLAAVLRSTSSPHPAETRAQECLEGYQSGTLSNDQANSTLSKECRNLRAEIDSLKLVATEMENAANDIEARSAAAGIVIDKYQSGQTWRKLRPPER